MIPWILRTLVAPPWAVHERSPYLKVAARLRDENALSIDERLHRQWLGLKGIVDHAWKETPFYRRRLGALGFEPDDLRSWDDLQKLPILTKSDIRHDLDSMVARSSSPRSLLKKKTSGSTGVSLNFMVDDASNQWKRGVALYRDQWTGWRPGELRAMVWGNPPDTRTVRQRLRRTLLDREFYLDTLRMDESMMHSFARRILKRNPTLLFGHAHSLYLFARFWKQGNYPVYRFKGILSTAMMLHPHERLEIESVFGPAVYDRYGCEEVSLIASECEGHRGLHTNTDSLVVEILEETSGGGEAEGGRIIVTDLTNTGMPFIRYEVGDRAETSSEDCVCGRSYPLLRRVTGRIADYLLTPDGYWVSGISLTENMATLIPGVEQVQIVQDEIDRLTIRIVPSKDYGDESRRLIGDLVSRRFGSSMRHHVDITGRIPQERSGKYRFSICRVQGSPNEVGSPTPPTRTERPEERSRQ